MSVFFIKIGLISICPEQDVWHPVRGYVHLFTDDFQIYTGIALDDQFIMDVTNDKAVPKYLHSIAENITADGLGDILYELRTVGFDASPLFGRAHAFIGMIRR